MIERTEADKRAHEENESKPMPWVLEELKNRVPEAHAEAEIVGRWVWIGFSARPEKWVRDELHRLGFRWNRRRKVWQHCCGIHTARSPGNPRFKYGSVRVGALEDDTAAVA